MPNHVNQLLNGDFTRTYAHGSQTYPTLWEANTGVTSDPLNGVVDHDDARDRL